MKKEYKYLPASIALAAGLVISIVRIINKGDSLKSLILVLAFLLGFYVVGLIFRALLIKLKTKDKQEENIEAEELQNVDTDNTENTENKDNSDKQ